MELERYSLTYFRSDICVNPYGTINDFRYLPRPYAGVGFIKKGQAALTEYLNATGTETRVKQIDEGMIFYVPRGSTYDSSWTYAGTSHHYSIHFEIPSGTFNSQRTYVEAIPCEKLIAASGNPSLDPEREFTVIHELFLSDDHNVQRRFEIMSRFFRILAALHPCLEKKIASPLDREIEPALDYIRIHCAEPLQVPLLASLCGLSESHFYARFRRATGLTPIEYKNRVAISSAGRILIDEPEVPVEEVSERMGFASSSYFRRVFARIAGCPPREFRKTNLSSGQQL